MSAATTTPVSDGVLRAFDLSHLDPADTLVFDSSVAHIFRDATRPGAKTHPNRDQAVATVLLLAAANSTRNANHYRALARGPRFGSPWNWEEMTWTGGATLKDFDVVTTEPGALLRRARLESWLRDHNEDSSSAGAAAARKYLDDHPGLAEDLGPVIVEHFVRAASILPPPVRGVVNSPAPAHELLLQRLGEVGGVVALDLVDRINTRIGTGQIAERARSIEGLAGVEEDGRMVRLATRSGLTAQVGGFQRQLTLQGIEGARSHSTIPIRRSFTTAEGILDGLCRALTEYAGARRLPEGITARTLIDGVLTVSFPLDAVHVSVLVGDDGPCGFGLNSHTSRALVGRAFLQEWCTDNGHDYDQTLDLIQQVRTGLLAGPDAALFAQLPGADRA